MLVPVLIAYVLFPDTTTRVLAQTATEAGPWLTLANLGVGGIFLWAFTTGRIHSDKELQRVINRCDTEHERLVAKLNATEEELRVGNKQLLETIVPMLTKVALLLGRFADRQSDTPPPKGRL